MLPISGYIYFIFSVLTLNLNQIITPNILYNHLKIIGEGGLYTSNEAFRKI